jgi:hypothetical protein
VREVSHWAGREREVQGVGNALGGLSGPGLAREDDELRVAVEHGEELAHLLVDRQLFADFKDVVVLFRVWPQVERVDVAGLRAQR